MSVSETEKLQAPNLSDTLLSLAQVRLSKLALLVGDSLAFTLAFGVSLALAVGASPLSWSVWWQVQDSQRFWTWTSVMALGLLILLTHYKHYSSRRPFWDELSELLKLVALLAMAEMALTAGMCWNVSRLWWAISWVLTLPTLLLVRFCTRSLLKRLNLWTRPAVIIGVGKNAVDARRALESRPELGLRIAGFVDAAGLSDESGNEAWPRWPAEQMKSLASQPGVQWVIALEHAQSDLRENWLRSLAQWGANDISVVPAMRGVPLYGTDMSHFFSHEVAMLRMRNNLRHWPARLTKRVFDTLVAVILLCLLSPVMLVLAIMIRRDGGPAIFAHPRVGKYGRIFSCFKFRTMVVDAERKLEQVLQTNLEYRLQWEAERKLRDDPRVSSFGRFLRRSSLDELPQLINVIRGEMSLVGPRPVVSSELPRFGQEVGYYLMVRPGMTGLWQVSGRNDVDYLSRVYLDTWYVKNWSLWYDLVILFKTISVVLRREGAY